MRKKLISWGNTSSKNVFDVKKFEDVSKSTLISGNLNSYGDASIPLSDETLCFSKNKIFNAKQTIADYVQKNQVLLYGIPGKRNVTLAGALASDTHGKDNVWGGGFSKNIESFNLLNWDGKTITASQDVNSDIFYATIGGYGLTGGITDITFKENNITFSEKYFYEIKIGKRIENLFSSFESVDAQYWVGWVDLTNSKYNWYVEKSKPIEGLNQSSKLNGKDVSLKVSLPFIGKNKLKSMNAINMLYLTSKKLKKRGVKKAGDMLYPLGVLSDTRNFAKNRKIIQVQFSLPLVNQGKAKELIDFFINDQKPILCSVKRINGSQKDLNLSFLQNGWTFAVDIAYENINRKSLYEFYNKLIQYGGKIYLAKDFTLNEELFKKMFSNYEKWEEVVREIDPNNFFQSELSKRLGLKQW